MTPRYPGYDVLAKWDSPSFDDTTRAVLARRLRDVPPRRFLSEDEWALLVAVCARLMPQPERPVPIPIVPWIDDMLHTNRGEGFRKPGTPPLQDAWRLGLAALDAEALLTGRPFVELAEAQQDALLARIAAGEVRAAAWQQLPARHFFVQILLKTAAGIYYAHPDAWSEIGFGGPASPRGYVRLGFDQRDAWEAREER
jgi:hypothetical protein